MSKVKYGLRQEIPGYEEFERPGLPECYGLEFRVQGLGFRGELGFRV